MDDQKRKEQAVANAEAEAKARAGIGEASVKAGEAITKSGEYALGFGWGDQDPEKLQGVLVRTGMPMFMSNIQLLQSNSTLVTQRKAQAATFQFGPTENLGQSFTCFVGPWRPHAKLIENRKITRESYDPESTEFEALCQLELELKSLKTDKIVKVGVDFLLWLPERERFALFLFASTAKPAAESFQKLSGKVGTVWAELVTSGPYSWYVPAIKPYDGETKGWKLPTAKQLEEAAKIFRTAQPAVGSAEEVADEPARPR